MASRIDTVGHTKTFDYPVAEHWGETEMFMYARMIDFTGLYLCAGTLTDFSSFK